MPTNYKMSEWKAWFEEFAVARTTPLEDEQGKDYALVANEIRESLDCIASGLKIEGVVPPDEARDLALQVCGALTLLQNAATSPDHIAGMVQAKKIVDMAHSYLHGRALAAMVITDLSEKLKGLVERHKDAMPSFGAAGPKKPSPLN